GSQLGLSVATDGRLHVLLTSGRSALLTVDSLAAAGDVRVARCDLDDDGDSDLVLGFGPGSGGQLSLVHLEDGVVASLDALVAGSEAYRAEDGQTHPACGDVDGDGRAEILVGFGPSASATLQAFDDRATGYAALRARGVVDGFLLVPRPTKVKRYGAATIPALGDIDGDRRDELVVGFDRAGIREISILDDARAGFASHPNVTNGDAVVQVARRGQIDSGGGGTFPALGDWDGDGRDEIAVGFGPRSGGWIVFLEDALAGPYERNAGFLRAPSGRADYRARDGETRPSFGDLDGDGRAELVVGFGPGADHELEVFDDFVTAGDAIREGGIGFATGAPGEVRVPSAEAAP
ncbi:MAG TPA: VCBS repeat-containing protein, partial [Myxococcota bacterium]|nr:VCBS repeat-containing protein [Myxococcota bacterium]